MNCITKCLLIKIAFIETISNYNRTIINSLKRLAIYLFSIFGIVYRFAKISFLLRSYRFTRWVKTGRYVFAGGLFICCVYGPFVRGQSIPRVPFDVEFADVTVHLTEAGRQQVQREVERLYTNRNLLRQDAELLNQLVPLLTPLFEKEQLPADYRYAVLPFADDDRAAYWGLTVQHGAELGLRADQTVDERYHPLLATGAATMRLGILHQTSGNYVQTLLNYLRAMQRTNAPAPKADPAYLLLDAQNSPPLIWKILARKLAYEQEQPFGRPANPYVVYVYHQGEGQSLQAIAQQLHVSEDRFEPFNQWLLSGPIPTTKAYPVLVRVRTDEYPSVQNLAARRPGPTPSLPSDIGFPVLTKMPAQQVYPQLSAVYYRINDRPGIQAQPNDNVVTLSFLGKIPIESLLKYNDLGEQDLIQPGQIYYLARKAKRAKVPFHVVQRNQTLREIAHTYGVQLASLLHYNHIKSTQRVQAGRVVWLQRKRPLQQPVEYQQLPVEQLPVPPVPEPPVVTSAPALLRKPELATEPTDTLEESGETLLMDTFAKNEDTVSPDAAVEREDAIELDIILRQQAQERYPPEPVPLAFTRLRPLPNVSTRKPVLSVPKPFNAPVAVAMPRMAKAKPAGRVVYHVVKPGQTVYRIALMNRVRTLDLVRWNSIKNYLIIAGQRLIIRRW